MMIAFDHSCRCWAYGCAFHEFCPGNC